MASISATPDANFGSVARPTPSDSGSVAKQPVSPAQDEADLRLVIEEGQTAGAYIYKTVNRVTGEVVAQFPREQMLHMRDQANYEAGAVINAKV